MARLIWRTNSLRRTRTPCQLGLSPLLPRLDPDQTPLNQVRLPHLNLVASRTSSSLVYLWFLSPFNRSNYAARPRRDLRRSPSPSLQVRVVQSVPRGEHPVPLDPHRVHRLEYHFSWLLLPSSFRPTRFSSPVALIGPGVRLSRHDRFRNE